MRWVSSRIGKLLVNLQPTVIRELSSCGVHHVGREVQQLTPPPSMTPGTGSMAETSKRTSLCRCKHEPHDLFLLRHLVFQDRELDGRGMLGLNQLLRFP
jgi:hypothetical protein